MGKDWFELHDPHKRFTMVASMLDQDFSALPIAIFTRTKKRFTAAHGPRCNAGIICITKVSEAENIYQNGFVTTSVAQQEFSRCILVILRRPRNYVTPCVYIAMLI